SPLTFFAFADRSSPPRICYSETQNYNKLSTASSFDHKQQIPGGASPPLAVVLLHASLKPWNHRAHRISSLLSS
ncbi:unnamed protein product, partial [Linum tenue]